MASEDRGGKRQRLPALGFTLVEILIAILILGIVLATIYAAYTGTLRVARSTEQDDELYGRARGFFMRLTKDIGGLAPYREGYDFVARPFDINNQTFLRLSFRSSAHLTFSERDFPAGTAKIGYEILEDKKNGGYQLLRLDSLFEETTSTETLSANMPSREELLKKSFILCNGIQSLTFKFYDIGGKEYDTWDSGSTMETQKKRAPAMILVQLNLMNPGNKERPLSFTTRIVIPVNKVDSAGISP